MSCLGLPGLSREGFHPAAAAARGRPALQPGESAGPRESYQGSVTGPDHGHALARLVRGTSRLLTGDRLKTFQAELARINELEPMECSLTTPEQFAARTAQFRRRLEAGETLEQLRPEAYAVARRAAQLATADGLRAYDCQMLGALAMDGGYIAEMKTGEGKTLSAVMPLYLNALMGGGAHLITVNDALAQRDKDEMAPVFKLLGLSVGCVLESHSPGQKRAGYQCDVTYTTDRAVGFDYLRDQLVSDPSQRVQREPYFALIDEVDEVLIDQARVPLVVATQQQPAGGDFALFTELVRELEPGQDYQVDRKESLAWLTDSGLELVECGLELRETERSLSEAISHFAEQSELAGKLRSKRDHLLRLRQAIRDEWALSAMDRAWSDHLEGMEELREGVRWETLIEKDPQQAYIQRGYQAFEELLADLRRQGVVPSAGAAS
jgi:preprotein translocase subunit SecA